MEILDIPLTGEKCSLLVKNGWKVFYCNYNGDKQTRPNYIYKQFNFDSYKQVVEFVNNVCNLCEKFNRYPDITFGMKNVLIKLYHSSVKNPTEMDIILAEKISKF